MHKDNERDFAKRQKIMQLKAMNIMDEDLAGTSSEEMGQNNNDAKSWSTAGFF